MHHPFTRGNGRQGAGTIKSRGRLLLPVAMLCTLGFMTLFESIKTLLLPSITIWQSHLITIAATTAIAAVVASFVRQRLRRSEANLIEAQAFAHVGNYEWEIGDDVVSWSPEMFRIYGISPETFDSKIASVTRRIHPQDLWRHEKCIADRLAGKPFEAYEYRVVRPDGSERIVQVLKSVLERDAAGEPLRISGVIMDITERRRAERTLLEERTLLRTLIDSMPDRIYVKDSESRWVVANRALAELVGAKNPEELIIGRKNLQPPSSPTSKPSSNLKGR